MIHYGQVSGGFLFFGRRRWQTACASHDQVSAKEVTMDINYVTCNRCLRTLNERKTGVVHYGQHIGSMYRTLCGGSYAGIPFTLESESVTCDYCKAIMVKDRERRIAWIEANGFGNEYIDSTTMIENMAVSYGSIMTWSNLTNEDISSYTDVPFKRTTIHFGTNVFGADVDESERTALREILTKTFGENDFTDKSIVKTACGSEVMPTLDMVTNYENMMTCKRCLRAISKLKMRMRRG